MDTPQRMDELPGVVDDPLLITAAGAVDEEAARIVAAGAAGDAAVRGGDDDGRQLAAADRFVQRPHEVIDQRLFILHDAVQVKHRRVLFLGIVTGRQVDVKVPLDAQRGREDAMVGTVIRGVVKHLAADAGQADAGGGLIVGAFHAAVRSALARQQRPRPLVGLLGRKPTGCNERSGDKGEGEGETGHAKTPSRMTARGC
jgi:hypothetical protein